MQAMNKQTWKQKVKAYGSSPLSLFLLIIVTLASLITVCALLFLIGYIMIKGIPNLTPSGAIN